MHFVVSITSIIINIITCYCFIVVIDAQLLSAYEQAYGLWKVQLTKSMFAIPKRRWYLNNVLLQPQQQEEEEEEEQTITSNGSGDLQLLFPDIVLPRNENNSMHKQYKDDGKEQGSTKINHRKRRQISQHHDDDAVENNDMIQTNIIHGNEQTHKHTTIYTTKKKKKKKKKRSVKSVSCILNLKRNGKFTLSLVNDDTNDDHDDIPTIRRKNEQYNNHETTKTIRMIPHDDDGSISTSTISNEHRQQSLNGEWYLTPNPYCVTDRQYDTLLLVSEPRLRRRRLVVGRSQPSRHRFTNIGRSSSSSSSSFAGTIKDSNTVVVERATVELQCKVYGRYSIRSIRNMLGLKHGRVNGRMTCGTIVIVKEELVYNDDDDDDDRRMRRRVKRTKKSREVIGSFCGRTIVDGNADDSRTYSNVSSYGSRQSETDRLNDDSIACNVIDEGEEEEEDTDDDLDFS